MSSFCISVGWQLCPGDHVLPSDERAARPVPHSDIFQSNSDPPLIPGKRHRLPFLHVNDDVPEPAGGGAWADIVQIELLADRPLTSTVESKL